jgi:hypothetical protein
MADEKTPQPLDYRRPPPKAFKAVEDPEATRWRYRRILFRISLFVLLSPFTFYFVPNLIKFGKLTHLTPADFIPTVQQFGVPAVRAIKEYQRDTGKFPDEIQDLVPKYLPSGLSRGGDIENGQFIMWGEFEHAITYDFTPGIEGWTVTGAFTKGRIPLPPVTIGPATQPMFAPR